MSVGHSPTKTRDDNVDAATGNKHTRVRCYVARLVN